MGEKEFYRKKIVDAAFDLGLEELRKLYYWINSMRCKIFDQNMVNIKVSDSAYLLIQVTDRMVTERTVKPAVWICERSIAVDRVSFA